MFFYKWNGLKRLRTPRLKYTKFVDNDGKRTPKSTIAKQQNTLAHEEWKGQPEKLPPPKLNPEYLEELNLVLSKQGNNKTPGTDNLKAQLVKYLDDRNRQILIRHMNTIHPENWKTRWEASVVSIPKNGASSKLENYRPISLLQTFYKLLVAMVKNWLAEGLETFSLKTQYGWRKGRSTSHAFSLARHLQTLGKRILRTVGLGESFWQNRARLFARKPCVGSKSQPISKISSVISYLCLPQFKVSSDEGSSYFFIQRSGTRQGCPLAPFPSILVLSLMFAGINKRLRHQSNWNL